jgi:hypothetical protein
MRKNQMTIVVIVMVQEKECGMVVHALYVVVQVRIKHMTMKIINHLK